MRQVPVFLAIYKEMKAGSRIFLSKISNTSVVSTLQLVCIYSLNRTSTEKAELVFLPANHSP